MSAPEDIAGPYILWLDYGCEGWQPRSYPSIRAALEAKRYVSRYILTRTVAYDIKDTTTP
jgi:hypothetical protein